MYFNKRSLLVPLASLSTTAGVIILLARWISGNFLLSSPSALISYGFMAGICYTVAIALSFIIIGFFLNRNGYSQSQHKQSFLIMKMQEKLNGMNLKVVQLFYLLTGIEIWLIQLISISVLSTIMLNIPVPITIAIFLIGMLVLDRFISLKGILWLDALFIMMLFSLLIFIPIFYFVQNGASTVYEGIRLYHPYLFYFKNSEILLFYIVIQLAILGQVLVDKSTWYLIAFVKPKKVRRSLFSSGVILALLTLSFTAILMIALYSGSYGEFQILLLTFLYEVQPGFLTFAFLMITLFAIITTLLVEMRATKRFFSTRKPYYYYLIGLMVLLFSLFVSINITILGLIYTFAFIHITMLPFMIILLFVNRTIHKLSWLAILLSIAIGIGVGVQFNLLNGLAVSFTVSCIFQLSLQQANRIPIVDD
ncbi:permease [Lysinibacillus sphaericus]|uniref:permease n=1 Tax=Lysinibacillus sphaericus TaxID=1421 RepID=UPI0021611A1E|nr:permease [Lysinibacillus sphaericus]MCS1380591.1 permease [Lysinibacillus sphaericus]